MQRLAENGSRILVMSEVIVTSDDSEAGVEFRKRKIA